MIRFGAFALLATCAMNETVTNYADAGTYTLTQINGTPAAYKATFILGSNGQFSGKAPCNAYHGTTTVPYPWFRAGLIASTKMACPDLNDEAAYFSLLSAMTLAESSGPVLILSNDSGESLEFRR